MKKLLATLFLSIVCAFCAFGFTACDINDLKNSVNEIINEQPKDEENNDDDEDSKNDKEDKTEEINKETLIYGTYNTYSVERNGIKYFIGDTLETIVVTADKTIILLKANGEMDIYSKYGEDVAKTSTRYVKEGNIYLVYGRSGGGYVDENGETHTYEREEIVSEFTINDDMLILKNDKTIFTFKKVRDEK